VYRCRSDRGVSRRHADLIQCAYDVACGVDAGDGGVHMIVHEDLPVLVAACPELQRPLSERGVQRVEPMDVAVVRLQSYEQGAFRAHSPNRTLDEPNAMVSEQLPVLCVDGAQVAGREYGEMRRVGS